MTKSSIKIINKHYSELLKKNGFTDSGMGWRKGGLEDRYNIFLKYLKFKNKIILDYGCGICSFYNFLNKKNIKFKKYHAIEINSDLVKFIKNNYKNKILIKSNRKINMVDISISNGVHNYNVPDNYDLFIKDLNFLIKISKEAVGISFLNNYADFKEVYLSYKNLTKIIKFIQQKKLKFIVDQTFTKYETFLIIFK